MNRIVRGDLEGNSVFGEVEKNESNIALELADDCEHFLVFWTDEAEVPIYLHDGYHRYKYQSQVLAYKIICLPGQDTAFVLGALASRTLKHSCHHPPAPRHYKTQNLD